MLPRSSGLELRRATGSHGESFALLTAGIVMLWHRPLGQGRCSSRLRQPISSPGTRLQTPIMEPEGNRTVQKPQGREQ